MEYVALGIAVLFVLLLFVLFLGSKGMTQFVHRQTVRTVRGIITKSRKAMPHEPLDSIYHSIALHRSKAISTLREEPYMEILEKRECFRSNPAMPAEEFAETLAVLEDIIKLKKAGVMGDEFKKFKFIKLDKAGVIRNSTGSLDDVRAAAARGDHETALRLIRPLADQGLSSAQYNLGVMYEHGEGLPQDYAEAAKWYRKAAEQGHPPAQYNLGVMCAEGRGVLQDQVHAHKWFNLAVARFPASHSMQRDSALKNRDIIAAKMAPAQIAEAERLAREWKST